MNVPMPLRQLLLLFLLSLASVPSLAAEQVKWNIKTYRGQQYVPLSQVKEYYHFDTLSTSGSSIYLKNKGITLKFQAGSQEVYMNKVKFIFSNSVTAIGGSQHISGTDLLKVIDPILRPQKIKNAKAFDTVIIDAGHGGRDPGATNHLGTEAAYNLNVALMLRDYLKSMGFKVVMTRENNATLSLTKRVEIANTYQNAIFISLHFNSAGSSGRSRARGIETFTLSPIGVPHYGRSFKSSDLVEQRGNAQDSANIALATMVHWGAIQLLDKGKMSVPDRGVRRARFNVLCGVKHPAILLEGGFMTHPTESRLVNSKAYQKTLAISIAKSIACYRVATVGKQSASAKR